MSFNRLRPVLLVVAALGLVVGVGGVLVWAQPVAKLAAVGKFDAVGANPNYIVVNTPTQVLFTAKITDTQLKKRSVILLRTDVAGTPTDILGRLHDDGKNGDTKANDNIYSFLQTLTEPVVGAATFRIAARFKPGKWTEPESDDDDWDKNLTTVGQSGRDRPAIRLLIQAFLKKLIDRYQLSNAIVITVDPFKLPPDPGEAGKQTLAGIDSDNDGIRDDVQRWIAISFSKNRSKLSASLAYASATQAILTSADLLTARAADSRRERATACLDYLSQNGNGSSLSDLQDLLLNTPSRVNAYLSSDRLLGGTYKNIPRTAQSCDGL